MNKIRNILAIIGLISIIAVGWATYKVMPYYAAFRGFDDKALATYKDMADSLIETGNAVDATIWKQKVKEDLSIEDVEDVMKSVASELNIKDVGQLPLSKQVELMTGKKQRFLKIYMYCNPLTAVEMVNYSDAFSAYLPCRLSLVEDKQGKLWLYSLNMDMMIHGGKPLPDGLRQEAERVKKVIKSIMDRSASGEF
ncbi:MAG: DUF302 domain-containing protein [Thioalkalispiraceae bacterium]|jgi:uncharacterized protein (DUF302 family)